MHNMKKLLTTLALLGLFMMPAAQAETLSIINEPDNSATGVMRPVKGMKMNQVEAEFGKPAEIHPAVGEPPITRWAYDKFTVYFEREYVIHAVVHH